MKKFITSFLLLVVLGATAQTFTEGKFPQGQWVFITGEDGSSFTSEKIPGGQGYLKTVFIFTDDSKYEFALEEFNASGSKLSQVNEAGTYSVNASQFTLQPKSSVTKLLDQTIPGGKTLTTTTTANSLSTAVYNWKLEAQKNTNLNTLILSPVVPGFREGVTATHTRSKSSTPRPPVRSQVRAL
jgi:hypothetical protein